MTTTLSPSPREARSSSTPASSRLCSSVVHSPYYRRPHRVPARQPGHRLKEQPVVLPLLELADAQHIDRPVPEPLPPLRGRLRLDHERHVPHRAKAGRMPVRLPEHRRRPRRPRYPGHGPPLELLPPPEPHVHRRMAVEHHRATRQPRRRDRHQPERRQRVPHHHDVRPKRPHLPPDPAPQAHNPRLPEHDRLDRLVVLALPPPQRQEGYLMPRIQQRLHDEVLVSVVPRSRKHKPQAHSSAGLNSSFPQKRVSDP